LATYDFQCQGCGVVHEHIQSVHAELPDTLSCPRCGGESEFIILVAPAVATGGMSNMTQDMAIGKDSNTRWERILDKKSQRDKIRRESGKTGLESADAGKTFKPTDKQLQFVGTRGTETKPFVGKHE